MGMARTKNERKNEHMVREGLRKLGYYDEDTPTHVEEQKSSVGAITRLLKSASKSGKGGAGAPEFIVTGESDPDFLVIVECKADGRDHVSKTAGQLLAGTLVDEDADGYGKRVQRYAVDGALHYARALSKEYNVIAIGASGETRDAYRLDTFLHAKGAKAPKALTTKAGKKIDKLLTWADYVEHATFDPAVQRMRLDELMSFSRDLHEFMRNHAKLTESEKPLLVSGTLIVLRNKAFVASYDVYTPADLQSEWLNVIRKEIEKAEIPKAKKASMVQPYSSIAVHPELGKATKAYPRGVLHELIKRLNEKVWPFISIYHDFDVVGQFYGEFLKYTGGDKKALGIVLTPRHITELCALLANVNKKSKVLDICAGTGGFLISAMHHMMVAAQSEVERSAIKKHGLIGVEQQPNMYALAASNMILRGDGKANLYQGSCFDQAIEKEVKAHKCTVGLLNPPFSQGEADLHELVFVKQLLDCLEPRGIGVAIVPVGCAITMHPARTALLKNHTLEAVMSMPDDLFAPVGTVTCLMVFTAHVPHETSNKKSWFGYWKSDGFVKTKHKGRIDVHETWRGIRDRWVDMFRNREVHPGESVMARVTDQDEWCAEAYMETDYSLLPAKSFAESVQRYAAYKVRRPTQPNVADLAPKKQKWKEFRLGMLFEVKKGKRLTKLNQTEGTVPYLGAIDDNNAVAGYIGQKPIHKGGTITVNYNGSVAEAFYQPDPFWATDDINVLYPKGFVLNPARALFITTLIRLEKYRFNYGRKWHLERMRETIMLLPATSKGAPDWVYIEKYMKSLPFADQLDE